MSDISISLDQDALHDQVDLTILAPAHFGTADPARLPGTLRLQVQFRGGPAHAFLVERRELAVDRCSVWGRGASALLSEPFAAAVAMGPYATAPTARAVAAELVGDVTGGGLVWALEDWVLPASYTYAGDAMEGLQTLAAAAGGVVQALPAGGMRVRPRWPGGLAVIRDDATPAAARLDEDCVLSCSVAHEAGTPVDRVELSGTTSEAVMPSLEVEGSPAAGEDMVVRAYGQSGLDVWDVWTSSGRVTPLGTSRETVTERIAFSAGAGQASRVVAGELAWQWIGADAGDISVATGATDLTLADVSRHGVADITYDTVITRWLVRGCSEKTVLFVVQGTAPDGVHVVVQSAALAARDRAADPIEDPLVTSERIALLLGQAWLLEYAFDRRIITVTIPWRPLAPGDVVGLQLPSLRVHGRAWVRAVRHHAEHGGRVVTEIDAVQPIIVGG
ncbi:hypothetical protein DGI_2367 [Megalodesulfovibrio gigas DSM 1382 = ATCC 19364]|uniref:Uncharacterized protein n=1 Tax=Megalodesulfovibrio gigas (strain ATCC 19364 / DSM 1382 / NCIMB 9332 / VKM B-1759) TaxID=1121448 RepID=T2GD83_MEGG1|nr:hypothetical protein DGI_2367 [Megalodesulfovibrio gigas DSM 1382 = ATCC 19364]